MIKTTAYTVKIRREFPRPVRSNAECIDGKTFSFYLGWVMNYDDPYPGEEAWIPLDENYPVHAPTWISSGDLVSRQELIEVEISESQWASMVSSLNVGSGTMCTLRHVGGERMAELPIPEDKQKVFGKSLSDTLVNAMKATKELKQMLIDSGMPKKKVDAYLGKICQIENNIGSNVDYVGTVFGEHMEKTVSKAKVEVDAYVTGTINRVGLAALRGSDSVVSLSKD